MANILYIEDDELAAKIVIRALASAGHEVQAVPTANEGIALAYQMLPDLILMDLWLPQGVDGWTAVAQLKADPALAHIPVIALSAQNDFSARKRALDVGCQDYIVKPFILQDFLERVNAGLAS